MELEAFSWDKQHPGLPREESPGGSPLSLGQMRRSETLGSSGLPHGQSPGRSAF